MGKVYALINSSTLAAVFNKGLRRAVLGVFAAGVALMPFTVISEDSVYVPDEASIIKPVAVGDYYLKPQPMNNLKPQSEPTPDEALQARLVKKPSSNRDHIWNYLVKAGFSDEQTAGIMGNIKQEHGYETSGDGLAQWQGNRRAKLLSMKNPHSLQTQLDFLVKVELDGSYSGIKKALLECKTIDEATILFCNRYERPGIPAMSKRIAFAHEAYEIYHKKTK
ncbi:MAG: phage tail-type lysozyme domain-containing protein [Clostridiales Family XIII bacterium]|jgi:hypothetical protein|nr:phage tail-type lysozyme domain-containing protein [Clostridiales Family XIII bacterium]